MSKIEITKSENSIYLTQDLSDLSLYQRAKAIKNFINNETLLLEEEADRKIRKIFADFGIIVASEIRYETYFYQLNELGKDIEITDIYENKVLDNCIVIGKSRNGFSVVLEDDKILQCGVCIETKERLDL